MKIATLTHCYYEQVIHNDVHDSNHAAAAGHDPDAAWALVVRFAQSAVALSLTKAGCTLSPKHRSCSPQRLHHQQSSTV